MASKKLQEFLAKISNESIGYMKIAYKDYVLIATKESAIFAIPCIVPKKLILISKRTDWQNNVHTEIHEITPELLSLIFNSMVNKSELEIYRLSAYDVNNKIKIWGYHV